MAEKGKKSGPGSFQTIPCQIWDKKGLQMFDFSHNITKRKKCRSFSKYSDQGCWAMFLMKVSMLPMAVILEWCSVLMYSGSHF